MPTNTKGIGGRLRGTGRRSSGARRSPGISRATSPRRRASLSARYPVNGAWPAEMRIDMLAAYLDFRCVRELALAISRGHAPPPTGYRGAGRSREAVWAKAAVDYHVAPGIAVRQNPSKVDLAALV